jgi:hypothetical protein
MMFAIRGRTLKFNSQVKQIGFKAAFPPNSLSLQRKFQRFFEKME